MAFIRNLNAWKNKAKSAKEKVRSTATVYVQNNVRKVFMEAVRISPQWSGDYAANWNLVHNRYRDPSYDPRFKKANFNAIRPNQHKAGDPEAIAASIAQMEEQLPFIKWNSTISLVNMSPTTALIESGKYGNPDKPRPENLIPGGKGVVAYLNMKFKYLGKN